MFAAAAFDETEWDAGRSGAWTVTGRLRERQRTCLMEAAAARRRQEERSGKAYMMTAALMHEQYKDDLKARWRGGPTVLAFLFAHPDSDAIASLDERGEYLSIRSGDQWDLFFPGYYESDNERLESELRSRSVGRRFAANWYFNATAFDTFRHHVEQAADLRWRYSGETDLVLVNVWLPEQGQPTVDWESTQSWCLETALAHRDGPTLSMIVESISADLEHAEFDSRYGIIASPQSASPAADSTAKKVMVGALSGIAAALAKRGLGL